MLSPLPSPGRKAGRRSALALCLALAAARSGAAPPTEYEVKAAFLFHFARLVEWPDVGDPTEPFVIGIMGDDPFGSTLEGVIGVQTVRSRPIQIRRYHPGEELDPKPHILFVAAPSARDQERMLKDLKGAPVLTVGDGEAFAASGGMIGFRLTREGRVAFDINQQETERAGLKLSSQLLKLARIVPARS
jgi:YfiR/HmsC-like